MVEISYKKHVQVNEKKELIVCYHLLSVDNKYSAQCYVENAEQKNDSTYSEIKDFTRERQVGIDFVDVIAKGEVLPIHLHDVFDDYFA